MCRGRHAPCGGWHPGHVADGHGRTTRPGAGADCLQAASCSASGIPEARCEALTGQVHQLCRGGEVDLGAEDIVMAHVGRQPRQARVDVHTLAVPIGQAMNGEGVAQVIGRGPIRPRGGFSPSLRRSWRMAPEATPTGRPSPLLRTSSGPSSPMGAIAARSEK